MRFGLGCGIVFCLLLTALLLTGGMVSPSILLMFIDMHTHSVSSDDSRATVEQYVKWVGVLRRKGHRMDGFVLTEHRKFDFDKDYTALAAANDVLVLKGSELDTNCGHFLVYGVNERLAARIDFGDVHLDAAELVRAADECGAIAFPAHPGRFGIGFCEYVADTPGFEGVRVVEHLNGSNRPGEQERADALVAERGYLGTGGSDAHVVSAIGSCMTQFDGDVRCETDIVNLLRAGKFRPVRLAETKI